VIILIEHVLRVVLELCDRLMVERQGVKIAEGSLASLIESPQVMEAYTGRICRPIEAPASNAATHIP